METRPDLDKLQELVLYISHRNASNPTFGKTKLHKQLWMSDFHHMQMTGAPITGATYIHKPYGPFCADLPALLHSMEDKQQITTRFRQLFAYVQQIPVALQRADLSRLTSEELASVEDVLWETANQSAKEMSDLSHLHPGWLGTSEGEEISYDFAFLPINEPLEEPFGEWAEQHAAPAAGG